MPDITMCSNQECPNADYCERFTAKRSKRQSFYYFLPIGDRCESFWPNEKYRTFEILSNNVDPNPDFTTLRHVQLKGRVTRKPYKTSPTIYYNVTDFKGNKI